MTEQEYEAHTVAVADDIMRKPEKYPTPARVAGKLQPHCVAANEKVRIAAEKYLQVTARQFEAALEKRRKEVEREEKAVARLERAERLQQEQLARANKCFGGPCTTARDAVWQYMIHNDIEVTADLDCLRDGHKVRADIVEGEILLAAEAQRYTLGSDKIMTTTAIKLAFAEHLEIKRTQRVEEIWATLDGPVDPLRAANAQQAYERLLSKMTGEADLAFAAGLKILWQAKRRHLGLPVKHLQMVVFQGEQFTGKTELVRNMIKPLGELAAEADMAQVADDKNFGLRQLAVVLVDELAKADRADRNKAKTVITGEAISTRVHYSHRSQKIPICVTLVGTADKALHTYIQDSAGMRRFVPVQMKRRRDINIPNWQEEVVNLDWQGLWLSVDPYGPDPLMSRFEDRLAVKQEAMRARENLEAWLEQIELDDLPTSAIAHRGADFIELHAQQLYEYSFMPYEETFHRAPRSTSLTFWGTNLREMIDSGVLEGWSYRTAQRQKLYKIDLRVAQAAQDGHRRPRDGLPGKGLVLVKT